MSLKLFKLGNSYDVYFLLCLSLEVRIPNVGRPCLETVEFSKKDKCSYSLERDHSRVNTINGKVYKCLDHLIMSFSGISGAAGRPCSARKRCKELEECQGLVTDLNLGSIANQFGQCTA